jgi:hypothetical protein
MELDVQEKGPRTVIDHGNKERRLRRAGSPVGWVCWNCYYSDKEGRPGAPRSARRIPGRQFLVDNERVFLSPHAIVSPQTLRRSCFFWSPPVFAKSLQPALTGLD